MSQLKSIQDDDLPIWLPRLAVHGGPRFLQIAEALQAAVADGSLKPGDRLPPQRRLAAQLDVDLTTVTRAYDEARRRNLLEGRGARGTYIAAPKVELTAILDLHQVREVDVTAARILHETAEDWAQMGKKLVLAECGPDDPRRELIESVAGRSGAAVLHFEDNIDLALEHAE